MSKSSANFTTPCTAKEHKRADSSFRIGAEIKPESVVVASSFNRAPKEAAARVL